MGGVDDPLDEELATLHRGAAVSLLAAAAKMPANGSGTAAADATHDVAAGGTTARTGVPRRNTTALRRVARSQLKRLDIFWVNRDAEACSWFQHVLCKLEARRAADPAFKQLLHIRVFLTSFRAQTDFGSQLLNAAMKHHVSTGGADLLTGLRTVSEPGRPDWDAILSAFDARPHGTPQVLFCGPSAMASELRGASGRHRCDFAMETF
jgi:hypothetical protein